MELKKVKIAQVLPLESGTGKTGKEWKKQNVVVETIGDHSKTICVTIWGDMTAHIPPVGTFADLQIDVESREYNGKWYTNVTCSKVERVGVSVDTGNGMTEEPTTEKEDDGLPF
jgi:hypothetical protein